MYIFLDIGGTYTKIASSNNLKTLENFSYYKSPQNYIKGREEIKKEIEKIAGKEKIKQIIIAIAGVVDEKKHTIIDSPNLKNWSKKPLVNYLKKHYSCPIHLKNDAQVSALGEIHYYNKHQIIAYICIGTGLGGALVVNRKIVKNNFGFEPGRLIGESHKTLEEKLGGRSLKKNSLSLKNKKHLNNWHKDLAIGLSNISYLWSPELIIIGGGLADNYLSIIKLNKYFKKYFSINKNIKIKKAKLKNKSALWGALYYVKNQ